MTTNKLLIPYIEQFGLTIKELKDDFLPGDIMLETTDRRFNYFTNSKYDDYYLVGNLICIKKIDHYDQLSYDFSNFGKNVMNKVVKAYLENIIKNLEI